MTRTLPTFLGAKAASGSDEPISITGVGTPATLTPSAFSIRDIQDNTALGFDFGSGGAYGRTLGAFGGAVSPVTFNWSTFPGVTTVKVTLIGAGGYEDSSSATRGSGGGGGGASSVSNAVPVSHPESVPCWAGFLFGDSYAYFRDLATAKAAGGSPSPAAGVTGLGGAGGLASASVGDVKFNGGNGGVGLVIGSGGFGGGGGGSAGGAGAGGNASGTTAGVAGVPYGGPGATNPDVGSSLDPFPGGGSSGETAPGSNHTDGAGSGYIRVEAVGQWDPSFASRTPPAVGQTFHLTMYVDLSDPSNTVEVRDNQSYVAGSWVADPDGVGVLILGYVRGLDVEVAIDSSALITVTASAARVQCTFVDTGGSTLSEDFTGGTFGVDALEGDLGVVVVDVVHPGSPPTAITVSTAYNQWEVIRHDAGVEVLNVGDYYRQMYAAPAYYNGSEWAFRFDADNTPDEFKAQLLMFRGCAPLQFVANPALDDGRWYSNTTTETQAVAVSGDYTSTVTIDALSGSDVVLISPEVTDMVVAVVGQAAPSNVVEDPAVPSSPYIGITMRSDDTTDQWQVRSYTAPAPTVALGGIPTGNFDIELNNADNNGQWDTMCTALVLRGKIVDTRVPYVVQACSGTGFEPDDDGIDFDINVSNARVGDIVLLAFDFVSETAGTFTPTLPGADGTLVLVSTARSARHARYMYRFTALRQAWSVDVSAAGWGADARCTYSWITVADADRTDPIVSSAFDTDAQHGVDLESDGVFVPDISGSASAATDLMVAFACYSSQPAENLDDPLPSNSRPVRSQTYPDLEPWNGDYDNLGDSDGSIRTIPYDGPVPAAGSLAAGAFVWQHPGPPFVANDDTSDVALTMSTVVLRSMGSGGGGGGGTPPTISTPSPSTTSPLTRYQPVTLGVRDDVGLALVVVYASYAGQPNIWEIVHDNYSWGPSFVGSTNQKMTVDGGFDFILLRDGGWPGVPRIRVVAVNTSGLVASYP
jgi:hypothetical protein